MKTGVILALMVGLSLALPMFGYPPALAATVQQEELGPQARRPKVAHPEMPRITAKELKQMMDEKGEYVLVDTRDSYSYDHGHIEGAINIHYDPQGDPFPRAIMLRALPRDKVIIFYGD